jgi:hypothetical protein
MTYLPHYPPTVVFRFALKKQVMYLDFPGDTVQMQVVDHKVDSETACEQTAMAK